jgi:hypothetical protein
MNVCVPPEPEYVNGTHFVSGAHSAAVAHRREQFWRLPPLDGTPNPLRQ